MSFALPYPDLVIFDCDGVLVDTERVNNQVMAELVAEYGLQLSFSEAVEMYIGKSTEDCLRVTEERLGRPVPDNLHARWVARTRERHNRELQPIVGIEAILASLDRPYCVASNGLHAQIRHSLGLTGLLPWFEGRMFSAEDVARPKPAPDLFLHAARSCGADPACCLVVEDTPTGVRAARAAGMSVLGFAGLTPVERLLEAGAHAVFRAMDELGDWFAAAGESPVSALRPL